MTKEEFTGWMKKTDEKISKLEQAEKDRQEKADKKKTEKKSFLSELFGE